MVEALFPDGNGIFPDDNAPNHTDDPVQEWFNEHANEVQHPSWPAQFPDLNVIEPVLGTSSAQFPPPLSLPELETVLHNEWLQIPLITIQGLYIMSILYRIQVAMRVKVGQKPY